MTKYTFPDNWPPISEFEARKKVTGLVLDQVSDMLLADDEPQLITKENGRLVWSVSIIFTSITRGRVGRVGVLEVDARSGEVLITDEILNQVRNEVARLAKDN